MHRASPSISPAILAPILPVTTLPGTAFDMSPCDQATPARRLHQDEWTSDVLGPVVLALPAIVPSPEGLNAEIYELYENTDGHLTGDLNFVIYCVAWAKLIDWATVRDLRQGEKDVMKRAWGQMQTLVWEGEELAPRPRLLCLSVGLIASRLLAPTPEGIPSPAQPDRAHEVTVSDAKTLSTEITKSQTFIATFQLEDFARQALPWLTAMVELQDAADDTPDVQEKWQSAWAASVDIVQR